MNALRVFVLLFILCAWWCYPAYAGPPPADTTRQFNPRLVMLLTDTSEAAQRQRTQLFYSKIKNRFFRRSIMRRLFELFVDETPYEQPARRSEPAEALSYFQQFEGKQVRSLSINKLPVFGPGIHEDKPIAENWFKRMGNKVHFQTRDRVIRKNLLFKEGALVSPELLYDNERLLRSLSFIRDARIRLKPVPGDPEGVAVEVFTQDVFPLSISVGKEAFSSYSVGVQNNNIFGLGHRLLSEALYSRKGSPALGYAGTYMIENIGGTFANAAIYGSYTDFRRGGGLSLQRPFYTPDTRWAGGLELERMGQLGRVPHHNALLDTISWYASDRLDAWFAHSIPLNSNKPHPQGREALVLSARALHVFHDELPDKDVIQNDFFLNRKVVFGSLGWVRRLYRRDNLIYAFGRTEDVPLGLMATATLGVEAHDESLMYMGQLSAAWGAYLPRFGYVDVRAALNQYLGQGRGSARRLRSGSLMWISPLKASGRYKLRQLLKVEYMYGDRRLNHEYISIGKDQLRNIDALDYRGTQRFNASLETVAFSPVQFIGFRLAGFLFAEASVLNNDSYFSLSGRFLHGYGAGIRVRNENLVFKTFQVSFTYHPQAGGFGIRLVGSPNQLLRDFNVGKPQALPFR